MHVLLLGAVTAAAGSLVVPMTQDEAKAIALRAQPKCDALPRGFHWRYEDMPKTPNPTGYYWRFAELPKDVQDCWTFGPCTTKAAEAATRGQ
jgi:hypothetical protein